MGQGLVRAVGEIAGVTEHETDRGLKKALEVVHRDTRCTTGTSTSPTRSPMTPATASTPAQLKYLDTLVAKAGPDRFDTAFNNAVKGTGVAPRDTGEKAQTALGRLTKSAARKLITVLLGP